MALPRRRHKLLGSGTAAAVILNWVKLELVQISPGTEAVA
jgi:hypothetical protein